MLTKENIAIINEQLKKGHKLQLEYDKKNDKVKLLICKLKVLKNE